MKTVLNISGGLDSTYVLWELLSKTSEEITAVFFIPVVFQNSIFDITNYKIGGAMRANPMSDTWQQDGVYKICNWLKENIRDFTLIVESIDPSKFVIYEDPLKRNSMNTYFTNWAVRKINSNRFDKMVLSYEKTNEVYNIQDVEDDSLEMKTGGMICYEIFLETAKRGQIDFPLLDKNFTQAQALVEMPEDLVKLTSSCTRITASNRHCGECFKCKKREFVTEKLKSGKTIEQINWLIDHNSYRSKDGTDFYVSMRTWLYEKPKKEIMRKIPVWPSSYKVE